MRTRMTNALLVGVLAVATGGVLDAQRQRASPHEKTEATVDGAAISIEYGRPSVKGREIFGKLVPFDRVWRTGADEATTLVTDRTLVFGGLEVSAGKYTLYTIPGKEEWTLVVNKQTGQWGTQYTEAQDLGRVKMKRVATATPVEQFTITINDTAAGGSLRFEWADTAATADFTVK